MMMMHQTPMGRSAERACAQHGTARLTMLPGPEARKLRRGLLGRVRHCRWEGGLIVLGALLTGWFLARLSAPPVAAAPAGGGLIDVATPSKTSTGAPVATAPLDDDHEEHAEGREDVYAAYHSARRQKCDGCRYIPFYQEMYRNKGIKRVFDGGAANCGVMKKLQSLGYEVHGIEYSKWVVDQFCTGLPVEVGALHKTQAEPETYDLVLCTDVLEHVPTDDVSATLAALASLAKPGGKLFFVIASDPSKHENHPERSAASSLLKQTGMKIHETVMPRSWWLGELEKYGIVEDHAAMETFLQVNRESVHDPRYGFTVKNFKGRGQDKVYAPNKRHVARVYCLEKVVH